MNTQPVSVTNQLVEDLKNAMRTGDNDRRDVIRLLRSAFKNREIEEGRGLTTEEEIEVLQAQIKQRRDSIEAFDSAGRKDLATKERVELSVLQEYLPDDLRPMDEAELQDLVDNKIETLDLQGPADMGVLMPALIAATEGRADNRLLSRLASAGLKARMSTS